MLLESGSWFRLDRPELVRLRSLIDEAREIADPESGALRLSAHHTDFWDDLAALSVIDEQSARWAANVEALASIDTAAGPPIPCRATCGPRCGPPRPTGSGSSRGSGTHGSAGFSPTTWGWARPCRPS